MSIGQKAVRGALWTISTSVLSRGITLVGTVVLTRFLDRGEFGEVMVAQVVALSAHMFTTLGLGNYVAAHPKAERSTVFHATFYNLLFGVLALGAVLLVRDPLGRSIGAPAMGAYLPGLALAAMMDRIGMIPERVLMRDLQFRIVSIERSVGEVAYAAVSVWLAATGWGATAIVVGSLVRSALRLVICIGAANRRDWLEPHPLTKADTRELFRFGLPLSIGNMAYFAASRWDNVLIAAIFGTPAAGAYNYAYNLADVPASAVGEQIGDVLVPSFAHLTEEQRKSALSRAMLLLALIVFPLAVGLGAIGNTLTHALFPRSWDAIGPMLTVLAALSVARSVAWTVSSYLQAQKRTRPIAVLEILKLVGILVLLPTLGRGGPLWACGAVVLTFGLFALGNVWVVRRTDGIPMRSLLAPLARPLIACAVMVAAILALRYGFLARAPRTPIFSLLAELGVGAIAYIAAALVVARDASRYLVGVLLRNQRALPAPPDATA